MIRFDGVTKQYLYGARVLGVADFEVGDGEIMALLGDEGSGKTTLLKVASGVTECEGSVLIDGRPLDEKPDDVLMIFDDLAVFENRTFRYNLSYPLKIRGYDKNAINERVEYAADRMGIVACLPERVKKMPLTDVKRLAVARLFVRDARVILVDDICGGLCKADAEKLWAETAPVLIEKARGGASIIYSTTNLEEALSISDRIAVMHCGEIKQIGTKNDILRSPANIWASQALDKYYAFEKAELISENGLKLKFQDGYVLNASCFEGRIARDYIGKDVLVGWHSYDYDIAGHRRKKVEYVLQKSNTYLHFVDSHTVVESAERYDEVGTLPDISKAALFDYTNENSIMLK